MASESTPGPLAEDRENGRREAAGVLRLSGEIDLAVADRVLAAGIKCLDNGTSDLVVDLSDVSFLDSSGLGALVAIRNHAAESGRTVVVTGLHGTVKKVFEITGLEEPFSGHEGT